MRFTPLTDNQQDRKMAEAENNGRVRDGVQNNSAIHPTYSHTIREKKIKLEAGVV